MEIRYTILHGKNTGEPRTQPPKFLSVRTSSPNFLRLGVQQLSLMAPQTVRSKRMPSRASPDASSSEDEPENQAKASQAALKSLQSAPPKRPQSSSEDDTDESSDDSTQEKLDDKEPPSTKRPPQQQAKEVAASSDSESHSESESDEENDLPPLVQHESRTREPSAKPTVSKPTSDGVARSSKKRKPAEVASRSNKEEKKGKRPKVSEAAISRVSKEEDNVTARKRFDRIWAPEDEMQIFKALIAFKRQYGCGPAGSAGIERIYNEVKSSFHDDYSRSQFGYKLENLRRKYSKHLAKEQLPKDKSSHARAMFDLAKEIWGEQKKSKSTVIEVSNPDPQMKKTLENGGKSKLVERLAIPSEKSKGDGVKRGPSSLHQLGSISERDDTWSSIIEFVANQFNWTGLDSLKQSFALLDPAECKAVEDVWNHLKLREMEFQIQRLEAAKEIIEFLKDKMVS